MTIILLWNAVVRIRDISVHKSFLPWEVVCEIYYIGEIMERNFIGISRFIAFFGPRDPKGSIKGYRIYPKANDIGVWECQPC